MSTKTFCMLTLAILYSGFLVTMLALQGCGDTLSPHSNSTSNAPVDNSVIGSTEVSSTCEPVDSSNCNATETTNNVCFLQSFHCDGPSCTLPDGPNFVTVAPDGCVIVGDHPPVVLQEGETVA